MASNVVVTPPCSHADRNANSIIINMLQGKCRLELLSSCYRATDTESSALFSTMTGTDSVVSTAEIDGLRHCIACFISRFPPLACIDHLLPGLSARYTPSFLPRPGCLNPRITTVNARADFGDIRRVPSRKWGRSSLVILSPFTPLSLTSSAHQWRLKVSITTVSGAEWLVFPAPSTFTVNV